MARIKRLLPLLVFIVFIAAIWALHQAVEQFHYHDIIGFAHAIPLTDLALAFVLTVVSYLAMTGYDLLAVRYLKQPLQKGRVILASFISYSFSNNIGLSILAAGSLRYRLYSAWGLSAEQITKLIGFTVVTFWLGLLGAAGLVFSSESASLTGLSWLPAVYIRGFGLLFLLLVLSYLVFLGLRRSPFQMGSWDFALPEIPLGVSQILVGTIDWCLAGSVLFVLLPGDLPFSFPQLLGVYLLAQLVALISHVPGGLGVFESMILLFAPQASSAILLGSLLLYRVIYYLLPLALATSLLTTIELLNHKAVVSRVVRVVGRWGSVVTPQLLALTTLIAGALLLFSGATPAIPQRLHWLNTFIPLPIVELSHFLGSLVGAVLLLLSWGIQRRLDAAYLLTIILLAIGSLLSLSKGGDYEEALVLLLMLVALLPCHRYFYRKSSFFSESFSLNWVLVILLIFSCSTWLGLLSYKHVAYRQELWWHFALRGDASRFMRAAVGAGTLLLLFGLIKMLKPVMPVPQATDAEALQKARKIIDKSTSTEANLALLGDKALYFDASESGFIMYALQGSSWVAMGDPVAPADIACELAWQFRELVEQHGGKPVFYEVGPDMLHVYLDMGLSLYKLGEEAKVPLNAFSLEGSKRSGLRYTKRKLERDGCEFSILPAADVDGIMPRLKMVSDRWLQAKNGREKGFSLGFFSPDYLVNFPVAVVKLNGDIVAFANLWCSAEKQELSIDLMRYTPEAPSGIMEYLFIELILWGKEEGYQFFSLGMAPLAGLENRSFAPLWHRIGALLFRHGEHFYNFEGLRLYKEKFDPVWEPRYLACPGGLSLPKTLANTAALIAGGIKGIFGK